MPWSIILWRVALCGMYVEQIWCNTYHKLHNWYCHMLDKKNNEGNQLQQLMHYLVSNLEFKEISYPIGDSFCKKMGTVADAIFTHGKTIFRMTLYVYFACSLCCSLTSEPPISSGTVSDLLYSSMELSTHSVGEHTSFPETWIHWLISSNLK